MVSMVEQHLCAEIVGEMDSEEKGNLGVRRCRWQVCFHFFRGVCCV